MPVAHFLAIMLRTSIVLWGKRSRKKAAKGQIGKELLWWPARILQLCALLSFDLQLVEHLKCNVAGCPILLLHFPTLDCFNRINRNRSLPQLSLAGFPVTNQRADNGVPKEYRQHSDEICPAWAVSGSCSSSSLGSIDVFDAHDNPSSRESCRQEGEVLGQCLVEGCMEPQETWKMLLLVALCHFLLDLIDPAFKAAFLCSNPWHWHILDDYGTSKKQWRWNEITRMPLDQFIPWWSLLVITAVAMINAESMNPVKRALGLQAGRFDGGPLIWSVLHLWQICVTKYVFFHFIIFDLYLIHFM